MKKNICILFGGVSPEHEVSLRSAESILQHMDKERYTIYPVGITKDGVWKYFPSEDYAMLPAGTWESVGCPAAISPSRGQGLLLFRGGDVETVALDCVFPVLHGAGGEDGSVQGLMQLSGIPCVGPGVAASAAAMDKATTKLIVDEVGIRQANWYLVRATRVHRNLRAVVEDIERGGTYPLFVKPAGTGSSVGVSKVKNGEALETALLEAAKYDDKILVEEFIDGHEVEVGVLGNDKPIASVCGEILSGAEFYDYEAKYHSTASQTVVPAPISDRAAEKVRDAAVRIYEALGCRGLARADFFVTYDTEQVVFNEMNTIPGFTSISMYPKLFEASGLPYGKLIDELISLAMEG